MVFRAVTVLLMLSIAAFAIDVFGAEIKTGTRVVIISDRAMLFVNEKPSGEASECSVFTVDRVDGDRLWVRSETAFLKRSDVIPFDDALDYYTKRLDEHESVENYSNRAAILRLHGRINDAIDDLNKAIELEPRDTSALVSRGILLSQKGEVDKAIADYTEVIRLDPESSDEAYYNRAHLWKFKQQYDRAISDYTKALKGTPFREKVSILQQSEVSGGDSVSMIDTRALTLDARGEAWEAKGKLDKALDDYNRAVRCDPKYKRPRLGRRRVWEKMGNWARIGSDLEAEIKAKTAGAEEYNQLAWLRATCPVATYRNGTKAVELANKACKLTDWKKPWFLDTLAAAHAEAGDFKQAIDWEQKAIAGATAAEKADFEARLKSYQDDQPHRQSQTK